MISRRLSAALVAFPLAVSLAACGSDSSGPAPAQSGSTAAPSSSSPETSGSSSDAGSSSAASSSAPAGDGSPSQLVATISAGLATVTSVTFRVSTDFAGSKIAGSGKEQLENGKLAALDVQQQTPVGPSHIVIADGNAYISQTGIQTDPGKPFRLVTTSSSDPVVRRLAGTLQKSIDQSSIGLATVLLQATRSVQKLDAANVGGQQTTHYRLVVDASKVSQTLGGGSDSSAGAGAPKQVPVDLYLDSKGRPVQTVTKIAVNGRSIVSTFTVTGYDVPVTITAPPASRVTR